MLKDKIDIKVLFILILAGALILSFIFRPSKGIDKYEDEIKLLHEENSKLLSNNDSLKLANEKIGEEVKKLLIKIDSTEVEISKKEKKIDDLEHAKGKVSDRVRKLNANGVAKSLTEYLDKKTK